MGYLSNHFPCSLFRRSDMANFCCDLSVAGGAVNGTLVCNVTRAPVCFTQCWLLPVVYMVPMCAMSFVVCGIRLIHTPFVYPYFVDLYFSSGYCLLFWLIHLTHEAIFFKDGEPLYNHICILFIQLFSVVGCVLLYLKGSHDRLWWLYRHWWCSHGDKFGDKLHIPSSL